MKTEQLLIIKLHKLYNSLPKGKDSQGRILKILSGHDGISQHTLQDIVGIKPGSLSEVLIKLEKTGCITRKTDSHDKRRQNVYITDEGRRVFEEIHREHEEESAHYFDALTAKDKKELLAILTKLVPDEDGKRASRIANKGSFESR